MENALEAGHDGAPAVPYRPSLGRSVGLAALLFFLDAFVMNQGMVALAVGAWLLVVSTPLALIRKRYAGVRKLRLRDIAILFLAVPLVWFANIEQNRMARSRAESIIVAVNAYKAKEGHWPKKLDEVVPSYLAEVPRAKYVLMFGEFRYGGAPAPVLEYTALPPFGRPVFNFEKQKWSYRD